MSRGPVRVLIIFVLIALRAKNNQYPATPRWGPILFVASKTLFKRFVSLTSLP